MHLLFVYIESIFWHDRGHILQNIDVSLRDLFNNRLDHFEQLVVDKRYLNVILDSHEH